MSSHTTEYTISTLRSHIWSDANPQERQNIVKLGILQWLKLQHEQKIEILNKEKEIISRKHQDFMALMNTEIENIDNQISSFQNHIEHIRDAMNNHHIDLYYDPLFNIE